MSVVYASIAHGQAFLFTDYGLALAVKKFGQDAVDALPKFTARSKHAGKPKGIVTFRKVTRGGWVRLEGRVENRVGQIITAELRELAPFGKDVQSGAVLKTWDASWSEHEALAANRAAENMRVKLEERAEWFAEVVAAGGLTECMNHRAKRAAAIQRETDAERAYFAHDAAREGAVC